MSERELLQDGRSSSFSVWEMHRGYVTEETGSKDVGLRVSCMTDSLGHTAAPMMKFLLNYFILFYFQGWGAWSGRGRCEVGGKWDWDTWCKIPKESTKSLKIKIRMQRIKTHFFDLNRKGDICKVATLEKRTKGSRKSPKPILGS